MQEMSNLIFWESKEKCNLHYGEKEHRVCGWVCVCGRRDGGSLSYSCNRALNINKNLKVTPAMFKSVSQ